MSDSFFTASSFCPARPLGTLHYFFTASLSYSKAILHRLPSDWG